MACVGTFRTFDCPKGHERVVVFTGCGLPDCRECASGRSNRRAKANWKKIGRVDAPWGVFVFTCHPDLHPLIDVKLAKELEGEVWELLEAWLIETHGVDPLWAARAGFEGGTFGALSWIHPEGDEHPGTWRPHWNFLVPLATPANPYKRVRAWWKDKAEFKRIFERLRAAWKEVLERHFGKLKGEVDVWYEFRGPMGKKKHALQYFGRFFPGWSELHLNTRRWGYLADKIVSQERWEWMTDPAPRWGSGRTCSVCGAEMIDSGECDRESAMQIKRMGQERRREAG